MAPFLKLPALHLSPETIKSYENGLKGFFRYLHRERVALSALERRHCVQWMEWMFEKEYSASTRLQRLVTLKGYLRWLVDRNLFQWNVDALIQSDDFPQLDDMLPRPLAPSVDKEIQRRLQNSKNIVTAQARQVVRLDFLPFGPEAPCNARTEGGLRQSIGSYLASGSDVRVSGKPR